MTQAPGNESNAPAARSPSLGDRILKAGFAVLLAHICVKLSGLLVDRFIVNQYGLAVSDVYTVVFDTVLGTVFFIGEQCLGPAYLPVFMSAREQDGEARAWEFSSILFNLQFLILLVAIFILMAWPAPTMGMFHQWGSHHVKIQKNSGESLEGELISRDAQGYTLQIVEQKIRIDRIDVVKAEALDKELDVRKEKNDLAPTMLRWVAPGLLGMSLGSLTYMLLNGYKEFFFAAFGDAVLKLCILCGTLLGAVIGKDWRYIAMGAVIGGAAKLSTHIAALGFRRLKMYTFSFDMGNRHVRLFFVLILPLLAGILFSSFRDIIMKNVLTAQEGLPSYFKFGRKISDSISFLVPYTLSIALLPFFCDLSQRDDRKQLGEVLTTIIRMLVWFFVPLSIVLAAAALPLCQMFYQGEVFTERHASYSALVLKIFCVQLPFLAIEMMVMQAYFSRRRMIAPILAGFIFSILATGIAYLLVVVGNMKDTVQILTVVATSLVFAKVLKSFVLIGLLKSTIPVLPISQTVVFFVKVALAAAGAAVSAHGTIYLCQYLSGLFPQNWGWIQYACEASIIGIAGMIVYVILSILLKLDELRLCWQWTKEKMRMRRSKGA